MSAKQTKRRLSIESLEDRRLMAGSIDLDVNFLQVNGVGGDDAIQVMTPEYYREKWNLLPSYPTTERNSEIELGFTKGDDQTKKQSSFDHHYSSGGIFTITVTVIDDDSGI